MVRLDYIWFKVSQFSLVLGRLYRRLLWQSLTTTTSLHLYNNSFQIQQFDCSWVTWLQTFPPAGWVRTVKNFRSQKAQCSTTSDSECLWFFFSLFFFQRQLYVILLYVFHIHVQKSSLCCRRTRARQLLPIKILPCGWRLAGRLTTRWSSAWWCRRLGWPPTATPLRSRLERRRSRLKRAFRSQDIWIVIKKKDICDNKRINWMENKIKL